MTELVNTGKFLLNFVFLIVGVVWDLISFCVALPVRFEVFKLEREFLERRLSVRLVDRVFELISLPRLLPL